MVYSDKVAYVLVIVVLGKKKSKANKHTTPGLLIGLLPQIYPMQPSAHQKPFRPWLLALKFHAFV
jgi:hypothetical protein